MKTFLLLTVAALMFATAASADHIGVYTDAAGVDNTIPCGFTSTVTIIHKFTLGSTGSQFKLQLPPGSTFFSFSTTYTPVGSATTDLALGYGTCEFGSIALGTLIAILAPGQIKVLPADGQASIIVVDCTFTEHPATGGTGNVFGNCPVPTQPSTWGSVKALYR